MAYLKKSFTFNSIEQAQYFCQGVGRFCTQKDHHPEWEVSDGGKTVSVKLTSHFAGNKVTLFDFQLAEHMNQQFKITGRWFIEYPLFSSKTWTSLKVFLLTFFGVCITLQYGMHWGNWYPSASQRGHKPQAAHFRPLLVRPFDFAVGGLRTEQDAEAYAMTYVDEYHFKANMFTSRSAW